MKKSQKFINFRFYPDVFLSVWGCYQHTSGTPTRLCAPLRVHNASCLDPCASCWVNSATYQPLPDERLSLSMMLKSGNITSKTTISAGSWRTLCSLLGKIYRRVFAKTWQAHSYDHRRCAKNGPTSGKYFFKK